MARRRGREDDPVPVGQILSKLTSRTGWAERMTLGRLRMSWADIVGEHIAARSEPVKLEDGILHIRADGSAWATELTLLSSSITQKAAAFLGGELVRDVRVSASGGPDAQRGQRGPVRG